MFSGQEKGKESSLQKDLTQYAELSEGLGISSVEKEIIQAGVAKFSLPY